jgi:hypothetical protein
MYFQDRSAYSAAEKYVDRFWEYINRSQTQDAEFIFWEYINGIFVAACTNRETCALSKEPVLSMKYIQYFSFFSTSFLFKAYNIINLLKLDC